MLVFTEHKHISQTGVGQSGTGPADAKQVIAQDYSSSDRHRGSLWESLIYAGERREISPHRNADFKQ